MATIPDPRTPVVREFTRRVKRLRRVMAVFVAGCEHRPEVLVLLDGDTYNRTRLTVYAHEMQAAAHDDGIEYRVMNAQDFPDRELRDLIPTGYEVLWAREPDRLKHALERW